MSSEWLGQALGTARARAAVVRVLWVVLVLVFHGASDFAEAQTPPRQAPDPADHPPATPIRADRPLETKDTVVFRNGDLLYGTLRRIEADGSILWHHPDALEPIEFYPGAISEVQLGPRPQPDFSATNGCQVRLTNQDELEGNLVFFDAEKIVLETAYAGRIEIPRPHIQFLEPSPIDRVPAYVGPSGLEGWTHGKVAAAIPNSGEWKYRNGAFYASRSASIARDLKLPDTASIQFDLTWKGLLYIAIALYTDYLQPINLTSRETEPNFGGFYSLQLYNYAADLKPVTKNDPLRSLGQTPVPTMIQKNKIHLEIRVNKAKKSVALLTDGILIKQWIDPEGFIGSGTSMRFVHQGQGSVKLGNLRIAEWDGQFEERPANLADTKQDTAKLLNGDKVLGHLESIRDGKVSFTLAAGDVLDIPFTRVKLLEMAGQKTVRAKEDPAEIHALFRRGGRVTLRLETWTEQEIVGVSPSFGRVTLRPAAFERIHFNLPPPPKPAADAFDRAIHSGRAVVRAVRGSADFHEPDTDWRKLDVGKVLAPGSVIRTGSDSQVDLFLGENGPVVRLTPETVLGLTRLDLRKDEPEIIAETVLKLEKGRIVGNVRKLAAGSLWEVHTAKGAIAMNDGGFEVRADQPNRGE